MDYIAEDRRGNNDEGVWILMINEIKVELLPCFSCICLALCQHREVLRCTILEKYVMDSDHEFPHKEFWKIVNQLLPTAGLILSSEGTLHHGGRDRIQNYRYEDQ